MHNKCAMVAVHCALVACLISCHPMSVQWHNLIGQLCAYIQYVDTQSKRYSLFILAKALVVQLATNPSSHIIVIITNPSLIITVCAYVLREAGLNCIRKKLAGFLAPLRFTL